jgi:hypothetical protein
MASTSPKSVSAEIIISSFAAAWSMIAWSAAVSKPTSPTWIDLSGDGDAFCDSSEARGPVDRLAVIGEELGFYDHQEMRRRLPRLSTCCLGSGPSLSMIDSAVFDEVKVVRTGSARPGIPRLQSEPPMVSCR